MFPYSFIKPILLSKIKKEIASKNNTHKTEMPKEDVSLTMYTGSSSRNSSNNDENGQEGSNMNGKKNNNNDDHNCNKTNTKSIYIEKKRKDIGEILDAKIINHVDLRKITWGGIPNEYRAKCWRVYLRTVNLNNDSYDYCLENRYQQYNELLKITKIEKKSRHQIEIDVLRLDKNYKRLRRNSTNSLKLLRTDDGQLLHNDTTVQQIDNSNTNHIKEINDKLDASNNNLLVEDENTKYDIQNNNNALSIEPQNNDTRNVVIEDKNNENDFSCEIQNKNNYKIIEDYEDISSIYVNILSVYAYQRPAIGYVQGMADILVPFIHVFYNRELEESNNNYAVENDICNEIISKSYSESSAYFCFSRFIDNLQDSFVDFQTGITKNIKRMKEILEIMEPSLARHLMNIGLDIHMFAFRWFNCLFVREFSLENILVIFDALFSSKNENYSKFILFFAVTFLISLKDEILARDFGDNLIFLQEIYKKRFTVKDIHVLLAWSYVNQNLYG